MPITIGVLIAPFSIQRFGTGRVGALFGPITCVWFIAIGVLGLQSIIETPVVLAGTQPDVYGQFCDRYPGKMFPGCWQPCSSRSPAARRYADMGHFGARAVRIAWFGLVCPALMLNYFGQGHLRAARRRRDQAFRLAPDSLLLALVVLATCRHRNCVTGSHLRCVSINATRASRVGLSAAHRRASVGPRADKSHVGGVNWIMLIGVLLLVLEFRSSSALAAAYGIAVSGTMIITSILGGSPCCTSPLVVAVCRRCVLLLGFLLPERISGIQSLQSR